MFIPIRNEVRRELDKVASRLGVPTPVAAALLLRVAASALGRSPGPAPGSEQPEHPEHEPEVGRDV